MTSTAEQRMSKKPIQTITDVLSSLYHEEIDINSDTYCNPIKTNDIVNCGELHRLQTVMKSYIYHVPDAIDFNIFHNKLQQILNDFLYLYSNYQSDEEFDIISHKLGFCDLNKCKIFRRHYGHRTQNKPDLISKYHMLCNKILDKIHCYYQHSYDIGHRVSSDDRSNIRMLCECKERYEQKNDQLDDDDEISIKQLAQLISQKKSQICKVLGPLNNRYKKFNQISGWNKIEATGHCNNRKMFHFGVQFNYNSAILWYMDDGTEITPKYLSFKEELTMNDISRVTIQRFNAELANAQLHFNSFYRKKYWKKYIPPKHWANYKDDKVMNVDHILALMIYANCTELQYHFSKTYRGKYIKMHNIFYHLGKYLQEAVVEFGESKSFTRRFFHGISECLVFPAYIHNVCIKGPLSTSTSFEVAINFADYNQGIVIEFGEEHHDIKPKYFDLSWLSDYANEHECLFLQNADSALSVDNITNVKTGHEYTIIINALRFIDDLFEATSPTQHDQSIHCILDAISDSMYCLIDTIINHQLSKTFDKYDSFATLDEYGNDIINTYCNNQQMLDLCDLAQYSRVHKVFRPKTNNININLLTAMFPNLKRITVPRIGSCSIVLDGILSDLNCNVVATAWHEIQLHLLESDTVLMNIVNEYRLKFAEFGLFMHYDNGCKTLAIRTKAGIDQEMKRIEKYKSFKRNWLNQQVSSKHPHMC